MTTIAKKGVNFCTCLMCNTSFFFEKEDIKQGENFPYVECPCCMHKMLFGWNARYFKYVDKSKRP